MRMMRSGLTAGVTVLGAQASVSIGPGTVVDVDQIVAPGLTVGEALGELLDRFDSADPDPGAMGSTSPRRRPVVLVEDKE